MFRSMSFALALFAFVPAAAQVLAALPDCPTVSAKDTDVLTESLELFIVEDQKPKLASTVKRCDIDYPMRLYDCSHARFFLWWRSDGSNYFVEKSKFFQKNSAPGQTAGMAGGSLSSPGSGDTTDRNGMPPC